MAVSEERRAKLRAAGFVETTLKELLQLDDLDMQVIEMRLRIGREVKRRREAAKWSQAVLAERMGVSRTRIPAIESGGRSSFEATITAFLALGGDLEELGAVIAGKH